MGGSACPTPPGPRIVESRSGASFEAFLSGAAGRRYRVGARSARPRVARPDPWSGDAEAVGDSKVVWDLNRHQWLVRLGQAYRLTGDERFAAGFARHIGDWTAANPPGINERVGVRPTSM